MKFNPTLHTFEARTEQIDNVLQSHPDAVLMGSVARAALVGVDIALNSGRCSRAVRDLDFTAVSGNPLELSDEDQTPFPVDNLLPGLIRVNSQSNTASVLFHAERPDIAVEFPASVFEPFPVRIDDIEARTFHPDVMRRLHLIMDNNRPKDQKNRSNFEAALAHIDYPKLPDATFAPLEDLKQMVQADEELRKRRAAARLQVKYHRVVPDGVRESLRPVMQIAKHRMLPSATTPQG
jgi:hypothetical protein